jgi:hypothetical protein
VVDEADVGETALDDAVADDAVVVQRLLDADVVDVGLLGGAGEEKAPLARADLEDDAIAVGERIRSFRPSLQRAIVRPSRPN